MPRLLEVHACEIHIMVERSGPLQFRGIKACWFHRSRDVDGVLMEPGQNKSRSSDALSSSVGGEDIRDGLIDLRLISSPCCAA